MRRIIFGISLILGGEALAQETCAEVGVIDNRPIGYLDQMGESQGVHWDYMALILQKSNICHKSKLLPYSRIWQSLSLGDTDFSIAFSSPDKMNEFERVALIREVQTVVIARKGIALKSYDDLYGIRIGKTRGTKLSERFDHDDKLQILELNDYQQVTKMLLANRIDAIAGSGLVSTYQLAWNQALDIMDISSKVVLGTREQWLHMSKHSDFNVQAPLLASTVERLRLSGELDAIMDKHYDGINWREVNR